MEGPRTSFPRGIFGLRDENGRPLPTGARLVLSLLWSFARWWDDDPGALWVYPTAETLARITGLAPRSVWRNLAMLEQVGALKRETRYLSAGFRRDGYLLTRYPDAMPDDGFDADPLTHRSVDTDAQVSDRLTHRSVDPDPCVSKTLTPVSVVTDAQVSNTLTHRSGRRTNEEPRKNHTKKERAGGMPPGYVEAVCEMLASAVLEVTGSKGGPKPTTKANRDMVAKVWQREQASLEDWQAVIDAQARNVKPRRDEWRWLCLSTIHRPSMWARLLDAPAPCRTPTRRAKHAPARFTPAKHEPEPEGEPLELAFDDDLPI